MNPLDEIRRIIDATRAESAALKRQEQELRDNQKRQAQEGRAEPTLKFADITEISKHEMTETEKALQSGVWMVIQHKIEWLDKIKVNNIQHPRDIRVDEAIITANFRDAKILKKTLEQIAEVKMSPYFRQVEPLAMVLEIYMKQGHFNTSIEAYVNMGKVTNENAREMFEIALEQARKEADAKIKSLAEMESQGKQDEWWQMYLSTLPNETDEAKAIIVTKTNILIHKWEQHLMNELKVIGLRRQLQITEAVIQLIK
ncbi:hypothetical protein ACA910_002137 [Epithemia clementina (nom. ined.)]